MPLFLNLIHFSLFSVKLVFFLVIFLKAKHFLDITSSYTSLNTYSSILYYLQYYLWAVLNVCIQHDYHLYGHTAFSKNVFLFLLNVLPLFTQIHQAHITFLFYYTLSIWVHFHFIAYFSLSSLLPHWFCFVLFCIICTLFVSLCCRAELNFFYRAQLMLS